MNGKATLKRLEELAGRHAQQDAFADYEQKKLDDMTDEELARNLEHLTQVLRTLRDCGALGDVLKDEGLELEALELLRESEL